MGGLFFALVFVGAAPALASSGSEPQPLTVEGAAMVLFDERQIEGPGLDAAVSRHLTLSTWAAAYYDVYSGLELGAFVAFDYGFARTAAGGPGLDVWELDLGLGVRYRFADIAFVELGWMPLMLRSDDSRVDLPNTAGDTDGLFVGSRSVAWLLGFGVNVPLSDSVALLLRLDYRIRYFVSRGGEDLAGGLEHGGQSIVPRVGVSASF